MNAYDRDQRNRSSRRRGSTVGGLLIVGSIIGSLVLSAVVIAPRFSGGASIEDIDPVAARHARDAEHQQSVDELAAIIGGSASVLAIHQRGMSPYAEIVLWMRDADGSRRAEASELAVISHSRIMRTIKVYLIDDEAAAPRLAVHRFDDPAFCAAWRSSRQVSSRVLVAGVSNLSLEGLGPTVAGSRRLRLSLRFEGADGTDDVGEALIDAAGTARPG